MDLERAVRRARLRTLLMALVGLDVLVWAASFLVRWEIPVSDLLAVRPLGLLRWGLLGLVILVLLRR